jgi:hypothetical protein
VAKRKTEKQISKKDKSKGKPQFGFNIGTLALPAKSFNGVGDFPGDLHKCYKPGGKRI